MFTDRVLAVKGKLQFYGDEVLALKSGGIRYAILFGPLVVLLFPVLVIEIIVLLAFGADFEILQTRSPEISSELNEDEVPLELRQLIPFAKKWGIGDAEARENLIQNSSLSELVDLEQKVGPLMQQITDWTDGYSESQLRNSATAGYFIFLQIAYEEASTYIDDRKA